MKRLFLIRHAKTQEQTHNLDDYDRALKLKGEEDALYMATLLKSKNIKPDSIISSPAKRAIQTSNIIASEIEFDKIVMQNSYIYEAYANTLQEIISNIEDTNESIFLVGHNPSLSVLSYMLCDLKVDLPTCSVVEIEFDTTSWQNISKSNAKLISVESPKKS